MLTQSPNLVTLSATEQPQILPAITLIDGKKVLVNSEETAEQAQIRMLQRLQTIIERKSCTRTRVGS